MATTYYLRSAVASQSYTEITWSGSYSTASDDSPSAPNDKGTAKVLSGAIGVNGNGIYEQYSEIESDAGYAFFGSWLTPKLGIQTLSSGSSFTFNAGLSDPNGNCQWWGAMYLYIWHSGSGKKSDLSEDLQIDDQQVSDWGDPYWRTITSSIDVDIDLDDGDQIVLEVWGNHKNTTTTARTARVGYEGGDAVVDLNAITPSNVASWIQISADLVLEGEGSSATGSPDPPTLLNPPSGCVSVSCYPSTLKWQTASGSPSSYYIQISENAEFSSIVSESSVSTTTYTASLDTSSLYHWRVNASNSFGSSSYSNIWNFTTLNYTESYNGPDWYVDKRIGSNNNSGSIDHPWLTIAYACSKGFGTGNNSIWIREGEYNEGTIKVLVSGSSGSLTTFSAYNNENVLVTGGFLNNDDDGFAQTWRYNYLFKDFTIYSSSVNGFKFYKGVGVTDQFPSYSLFMWDNVIIKSCAEAGIYLGYQNNKFGTMSVANSELYHNGQKKSEAGSGIYFEISGNIRLINSDFYDNGNEAISASWVDKGVTILQPTHYALVTGCRFWNNVETGLDIPCAYSTISHNIFFNNGLRDHELAEGIMGDNNLSLQPGEPSGGGTQYAQGYNYIANNLMFGSGLEEFYISSPCNVIYNNTIVLNATHSDWLNSQSYRSCMHLNRSRATGSTIKNNLFVNILPAGHTDPSVYLNVIGHTSGGDYAYQNYADCIWDNNLYFVLNGNDDIVKIYNEGGGYSASSFTLDEIKTGFAQDLNSLYGNPSFSETVMSWSIDNTSIAYDAGTANITEGCTITNYQSTVPDIGWWEYLVSASDPNVELTLTIIATLQRMMN